MNAFNTTGPSRIAAAMRRDGLRNASARRQARKATRGVTRTAFGEQLAPIDYTRQVVAHSRA